MTTLQTFTQLLTPSEQTIWNEFMVPTVEEPDNSILKTIGPLVIFKRLIGKGGFGEIYYGNLQVGNTVFAVAVKLQEMTKRNNSFEVEVEFYKDSQRWGNIAIPTMHYYEEDQEHRIIAIDLLGQALGYLHVSCNKEFSLKTVLLLTDQMITRLEELHRKGYIHKDVKPDNFVMGGDPSNAGVVYLIDFGQVEKFVDENGRHKKKSYSRQVSGTVRYMSTNAHKGKQQSRRDDLLSLFYVILFFYHGALPWQACEHETLDEKLSSVLLLKNELTKSLVEKCPTEFKTFYNALRKLDFDETPNYNGYKQLFRGLAKKKGIQYEANFDWTVTK